MLVAVRDIKEKRSKPVFIAAAVVERVARARGIACTVVQSTRLLCMSSQDYCASLSRNPITLIKSRKT